MRIIPKIKEEMIPEKELEIAIDKYMKFLYEGYKNGYLSKKQIKDNLKLKF